MAENWGPGVSRTLSALQRQFGGVVWQKDKPPLDSELNLMAQIEQADTASVVSAEAHSGFLLDPSRPLDDFQFNPLASNLFYFGTPASGESAPVIFANVNGWVIPVAGTRMTDGITNAIALYPPPDTGDRYDFVFLEVWKTLVSGNPSTLNKPSATTLWTYGNVEFGGVNLTDDLIDPTTMTETTKRVQIQYRIRVVGSGNGLGTAVSMDVYPDGMDDPNVKAQGTASSPTTFAYTNMRTTLGDSSLWRAGDGSSTNALGTIDGYTYAIPICAIRRRNNTPFVAVASSGTPNQNGSTCRTPSTASLSDPRSGAVLLTQATLTASLSASALGSVAITGLSGSGLADPGLFPVGVTKRFLVIDSEIVSFTGVSGGNIVLAERGRGGTMPQYHAAGASVSLYSTLPGVTYSDQILPTDILDLRRGVTFGDWDYAHILQGAVSSLLLGNLRTTPKYSGTGGNTFGVETVEVSYLAPYTASPIPFDVGQVDGPDGIRTIWSDAVTQQSGITSFLDPTAPTVNGFPSTTFDVNSTLNWTMGADLQPNGFLPNGTGVGWMNGCVFLFYLGGSDGMHGAVGGFCQTPNPKAVRFVSPKEAWLSSNLSQSYQTPWMLRFVGGTGTAVSTGALLNGWNGSRITTPAITGETTIQHPGPMYPLQSLNFEQPFLVLGGCVREDLSFSLPMTTGGPFYNPGTQFEVDLGVNFDTLGIYYSKDGSGNFQNDPTLVVNPLLQSSRTLWGMLTSNGLDLTGNSSELYLLMFGDNVNQFNNGAFRIVGAGTAASGYTGYHAGSATRVVVRPVVVGFSTFTSSAGKTMTVQVRSQSMMSGNTHGRVSGLADAAIVLTDIYATVGGSSNPWNSSNVGSLALSSSSVISSQVVVDTSVLWGPGRGATPRIADQILRISLQAGDTSYLRNQLSDVDTAFPTDAGYPSSERVYDPTHIQLWNRLPSLGLDAPYSPNQGGNIVSLSEQDREHEVFVDQRSKTLVFRPFKSHVFSVKGQSASPTPSLFGPVTYPNSVPKDGAGIFTGSGSPKMGYAVPPEYMPRFGRQDIPYHVMIGLSDPFMEGINHLFRDMQDDTSQVFYIIGGENNSAPATNAVYPILFDTNNTLTPYAARATITGPAQPAYGARKQYDSTIISSDLGYGLQGIELPPYLGIARLYGVYERSNFVSTVTSGHNGAHAADRLTPLAGGPVNLLRKDATQQTLFIRKNGAKDFTGSSGDHTYVIPSNVIDISLIPGYTGTQTFTSYDYIVECVVFGFGRGFIDQNNFVLARAHTGAGATIVEGTDPLLSTVPCVVPTPVSVGDPVYEAYTRTVYQGDPYMTTGGSVLQGTDFTSRYGQIPSANSYNLTIPLEQFDPTSGANTVVCPNPRALQVMASMDFYTTFGTGKIGGKMFPGTMVDVGCVDPMAGVSGRLPTALSSPIWGTVPRAFTTGQTNNPSRASLSIQFLNAAFINGSTDTLTVTIVPISGAPVSYVGGSGFVGSTPAALISGLASAISGDSRLTTSVLVTVENDRIILSAVPVGSQGNQIQVQISNSSGNPSNLSLAAVILSGSLLGVYPHGNGLPPNAILTSAALQGGVDMPVNAGNGNSQISLIGMTERLPLGILLSDSDFLSENPLGDNASAMRMYSNGGVRAQYEALPFTTGGQEYTRFFGQPGEQVELSDGAVLQYVPNNPAYSLSGTPTFRVYRGGSGYVLSGQAPGGPLNWIADSFASSSIPIVKGAVLAAKALLVRNFHEEAFSPSSPGRVRSEGDELQLVVMTYGLFGTPFTPQTGMSLQGLISPTGYGEGYAAMERYRIPGRLMDRGRIRTHVDPTTLPPAPYPGPVSS